MTGWTIPDRDILPRIIFQLQRPDWHVRAPADGADGNADGKWNASNGTTDLAAGPTAQRTRPRAQCARQGDVPRLRGAHSVNTPDFAPRNGKGALARPCLMPG